MEAPLPSNQARTASAAYAAMRAKAERRLFWKGLYPHAVPFAPFLMVLRPGFFKPDRELIHGLANATTPQQSRDEMTYFIMSSANGTWLRYRIRLRVSTRRVEKFARLCLGPDTPLPAGRSSRSVTTAPFSQRPDSENS